MNFIQDTDPAADGTEIDESAIWANTFTRRVFIREGEAWNDRWEMGSPDDDATPCTCANCGWKGPASLTSGLYLLSDPWERMQPGDTVPAGECPECECCAFLDDDAPAAPAGQPWFYDASTRTILDENRLTVARDVGPQDAALILARPTPAVAEIIADMLAWEADKFDAEPVAYSVWAAGSPPRCIMSFDTRAEAQALANRTAGSFIGEDHGDLNVSGADLVDAFTGWRARLLAATGPEPAYVIAAAKSHATAMAEIAELAKDDDPDFWAKVEALAKIRALALGAVAKPDPAFIPAGDEFPEPGMQPTVTVATAITVTTKPSPRILITIEGGMLETIAGEGFDFPVQVVRLDYDTDGEDSSDNPDIVQVDGTDCFLQVEELDPMSVDQSYLASHAVKEWKTC